MTDSAADEDHAVTTDDRAPLFPNTHEFAEKTRTAEEAASAIGCDVRQVVKSLVFARAVDDAIVLVLCSGANTVDVERLGLVKADARRVREATGYPIGSVPPWGWNAPPTEVLMDEQLMPLTELWAAAGSPQSVFPVTPPTLCQRSGAVVTAVAPSPR
jgi:prolyl-tRNA editing enzyme YbaK/EbsC (Cys-tRNA(Pro) deacylase)